MGVFYEIPPTAGFSVGAKEAFSLFFPRRPPGALEEDFKKHLGLAYAALACSGTAAFYLILEALKELSPRKTVVIPAFVCPLVPLAIKRAGLQVELCDIAEESFDFDPVGLERVFSDSRDILAVVPVHLAGIPVDCAGLLERARQSGSFVIEDCAQSLGASDGDLGAGTRGDFAFFSLCRGKGLTIYEGGLIAARAKDNGRLIEKKIRQLVKGNFFAEGLKSLELLGYALFYRPQLFWFVWRLPQLFWESRGDLVRALGEDFSLDFPLHRVCRRRAAAGSAAFWRLEKEIEGQRRKAASYIRQLKNVTVIRERPGTMATYPYLTVLFDSPEKRQAALRLLKPLGLGVSQIYLSAVTDYPYLKGLLPQRPCPNARRMAAQHVSLSTSAYLRQKDLDRLAVLISHCGA